MCSGPFLPPAREVSVQKDDDAQEDMDLDPSDLVSRYCTESYSTRIMRVLWGLVAMSEMYWCTMKCLVYVIIRTPVLKHVLKQKRRTKAEK
jgi:hypothetical protein